MGEPSSSSTINTILFGVLALVVLLFIWFWISNPTRSVGEMTGTIEAITSQTGTEGHTGPERTAMIRLADGTLVQARVLSVTPLHSGQRARLAVSEQVLSGARTYEVVEAADVR